MEPCGGKMLCLFADIACTAGSGVIPVTDNFIFIVYDRFSDSFLRVGCRLKEHLKRILPGPNGSIFVLTFELFYPCGNLAVFM